VLLYSPWQPLGIPSAITPIGHLHQSLCLFVWCYKTRKTLLRLPPLARSKTPGEYFHPGRVALPAVLPRVHHRPELLYVPTEVNTLHVDGLACNPGLTQPLYRRFLSHRIASRDPPRLIPLSTYKLMAVSCLEHQHLRKSGRGKGGGAVCERVVKFSVCCQSGDEKASEEFGKGVIEAYASVGCWICLILVMPFVHRL